MKLIVTNTFTKIQFENNNIREHNKILNTLDRKLNPFAPFYYKRRSYRMHVWSGRITIVDTKRKRFPTGLLSDVYKVLLEQQNHFQDLQVSIIDHRAQTIKPEVPNRMVIGGHKLRDYQLKGIKDAIKYQRVTINSATNSGKTSIAVGITKVALHALDNTDNILLFTQSKDVTKQDQQSFEKDLGMPVGMLGGGEHTTHQVTCATARTLSSALKDPTKKIHLTSRKDKDLKYMVTKYIPKFRYNYNKGLIIRTYINTHIPRWSYDKDCFEMLATFASKSDAEISKILDGYIKSYHKVLYKKNKKAFMKYKNMVDFLSNVKVVFVDEAQHAPAKSFQKVLNHLNNARVRVALTGTVPTERVKHAWFIAEFGHHILKVSNHELIKRGISATPRVYHVPIRYTETYQNKFINLEHQASNEIPLSTPKNAQSIILAQLQNKIGVVYNKFRNHAIATIADGLYKHNDGVTLIVVNYLTQGKLIEDTLNKIDPQMTVMFLQGADDNEARNHILTATRQGKVNVLIATRVINEGLNIKNLSNMIYASAGKSSVELLQRVGRLLRKCPNQKYVYIFDIYDRTSDILFHQAEQRFRIYKQQGFEIMNKA